MKNKLQKRFLLIASLFFLVACSSGGGTSYDSMESISMNNGYGSAMGDMSYDSIVETKGEITEVEQKIIVDVTLDIETKEFEETISMINNAVKKYGGYVQSSSVDDNSYYSSYSSRYGRFVLRIPADKLDGFLVDAENSGNVVSTETSTQDVTTSYYDTQSHLEALRAQEDRLIAMYEKAETINDLISLENRLSNLRYEIDSNETKIRNYDLLTKYSTVTIRVEEVKILTETDDSFFGELKMTIEDSAENFLEFLKELLFLIIYVLPYAALVGLISIPVLFFVKKGEPERMKKREELIARRKALREELEKRRQETSNKANQK